MKENHHNQMNSNSSIRMNGSFRSPIKVESLSQTAEVAPTTLQMVNAKIYQQRSNWLILIVKASLLKVVFGYRQTVVIRPVGPMKLVLIKLQHLRAFSIFFG
jgi:hypothetical protein